MLKRNSNGFTLAEILIVGGIMAGVSMVLLQILSETTSSYKSFEKRTGVGLDVQNSFSIIERHLTNVARLTDFGEEIESIKKDDFNYLGLYAFKEAPSNLDHCLHEKDDEKQTHSVVRYTTILEGHTPTKLIKFWNEAQDQDQPLYLEHDPDQKEQMFFEVANNSQSQIEEFIIIDLDGFSTTRQYITYIDYEETTVDPYDDIDKSPREFKYFKVDAEKPKAFATESGDQSPVTTTFLTGSYVFPVTTKVLCASKDKKRLILWDEQTEEEITFLNLVNTNSTIQKFAVHFRSSRPDEVNFDGFEDFPVGTTLEKKNQRKCIDQVRIEVEVGDEEETYEFSKHIHLVNYHNARPTFCTP